MSAHQPELEVLARQAVDGDDDALRLLAEALQDPVFALSLRMLGQPEDARDATQEILIRTVTRLSSFRGESKLLTWVYRLATNYLIDLKRRPRESVTFEQFDTVLGRPAEPIDRSALEHAPAELLVEETFMGCSLALLRCLDREHRLAFIFGAILELEGREAAAILEVSPATYRKRLSRARHRIEEFMRPRCGVMNPEAPCRCAHQVNLNVARGLIDPQNLVLVGPRDRAQARALVRDVRTTIDAMELFRRQPQIHAPEGLVEGLRAVVRGDGTSRFH